VPAKPDITTQFVNVMADHDDHDGVLVFAGGKLAAVFGAIQMAQDIACVDDAAAIVAARATYCGHSFEVWQGTRKVHAVFGEPIVGSVLGEKPEPMTAEPSAAPSSACAVGSAIHRLDDDGSREAAVPDIVNLEGDPTAGQGSSPGSQPVAAASRG
jgi:hypothetical protein